MRKLIAGMRLSVDGRIAGPTGTADWVAQWADDFELMPRIDACLIGGGMYPGYEERRIVMLEAPDRLLGHGRVPTPAELEWARFAAEIPHYVLSRTLSSARWPKTQFLRGLDEVAALKQQPGKDIHLIGGVGTTERLIGAGLVDELRLIIHPLLAGEGRALFAAPVARRQLELLDVRQLAEGRVSFAYAVG